MDHLLYATRRKEIQWQAYRTQPPVYLPDSYGTGYNPASYYVTLDKEDKDIIYPATKADNATDTLLDKTGKK